MAILPFGLPEPQSETLRRLCQQVREAPGEAWSSGQAAKACSMSERTLNRHFQQQTSLTWSEWVRRAKLMEALVRLAQGHLCCGWRWSWATVATAPSAPCFVG